MPSASKRPQIQEKEGLPKHIAKQLLVDIEAHGGIAAVSLRKLCDSSQDIYGPKASALRRKVQNKFDRLKRLSRDDYLLHLRSLGVLPGTGKLLLPSKTTSTPSPRAYSPPQTPSPQPSSPKLIQSMPNKKNFNTTSFGSPYGSDGENPPVDDPDVIEVDISNPERNREVKIYHFMNVPREGILHNGFCIVVECDPRDFIDEKYKARLVSTSEILVELPSMSYPFLFQSDAFAEKKNSFGIFCARTEEALEICRNTILDDESRQKKTLLLRFPEEFVLSNELYSPNSQNGEINIEMIPVETFWGFGEKVFPMVTSVVQWKVSIMESKPRVVKRASNSQKKNYADKLAQRFEESKISVRCPPKRKSSFSSITNDTQLLLLTDGDNGENFEVLMKGDHDVWCDVNSEEVVIDFSPKRKIQKK